ncbi:MAG: hypothetical protein JWM86_1568 [Thermoleophilia bacterium]|nr:hypothetical protein [Thermoleophilia bacterium]
MSDKSTHLDTVSRTDAGQNTGTLAIYSPQMT